MKNFDMYFRVANSIVQEVSYFLIKNFGTIKRMSHKTDSHYGIAEDKIANKMYEDYFQKNTPEVSLYTEEGERNLKSKLIWVIDPIEGTSNYRAGNPFFATQIALLEDNKPVLAIVNAPVLNQKFTAVKNKGAFLNGKRIKGSKETCLNTALVGMGRGTKDEDKDWLVKTLEKLGKKVRTNRIFGACGLDICYAVAGITDAYLNSGSHIYDLLPGTLIAEEAGASVVNFKNSDWAIKDRDILVSNSKLVDDILKII